METTDMVYEVLSFRWQTGLEIALEVKNEYHQNIFGATHFVCQNLVKQGLAEVVRDSDGRPKYRRTSGNRPTRALSMLATACVTVCESMRS